MKIIEEERSRLKLRQHMIDYPTSYSGRRKRFKNGAMNSARSSGAGLDAPSNLPDELQLQLAPGQAVQFAVPPMTGCEIQWEIAQLGKFSQSLADGTAQIITLAVPPTARPHALIRGQILIVRSADGALVRSVPVAGWFETRDSIRSRNAGIGGFRGHGWDGWWRRSSSSPRRLAQCG